MESIASKLGWSCKRPVFGEAIASGNELGRTKDGYGYEPRTTEDVKIVIIRGRFTVISVLGWFDNDMSRRWAEIFGPDEVQPCRAG